MSVKQYVLLDHLKPSMPFYIKTRDGKKVRLIDSIPKYGIPQRVTYVDKDGNYKTARYKANAKTLWQDEQIKDQGIPANDRFTTQERRDTEFNNMILTTNKVILQEFLETLPYMEGVGGSIDGVQTPIYRLLDRAKDSKEYNSDTKKRLKVGNYIDGLDLKQSQELVLRLFGTAYTLPKEEDEEKTLVATQNILFQKMDEASDEELDIMMKQEINVDEKASVLVGKLVNEGLLSFDALEGQVSKKDSAGKWVSVKAISTEHTPTERQRQFVSFLTSDAGKTLQDDLENDLKKQNSKPKNKS